MTTQKFMGKNQLVDRLTAQLKSQKNPPADPEAAARTILQSRGQMDDKGSLTAAGKARDNMSAEQRALDRAATRTGKKTSAFTYDATTNRATLRKPYGSR